MASKLLRRRMLVLLALVVISVIAGKLGFPGLGHAQNGFWDGPA